MNKISDFHMKKKRKTLTSAGRRITQGGMAAGPGKALPDVVLQMPQLFHFDLGGYMTALQAAISIDFTNRVRLYDMYESALLDLHLAGVIAKRLRGVTKIPIEFRRDGRPDDRIDAQLRSPWFKRLLKDIVWSEFWGFSLFQFYADEDGNIRYDLIPRKHYDPVRRKLLRFQGDTDGVDVEEFQGMLFVGEERGMGIFAELMPAVLYKRGNISDWAQFCNIFGMPIREYTYDAGDEEARRRLIADARWQGANAVYIHPRESDLNLIEAGNKTGSAELYKSFADYWDEKMSVRVLGNTLTTAAQETGTQALGTVHKEEEDEMNADDRDFILDVLNYDMRPIFEELGFRVEGGEFVYARKEAIDLTQHIGIVEKLAAMGLPIADDYLYETFGVEKPENYDEIKAGKEAARAALRERLEGAGQEEEEEEEEGDEGEEGGKDGDGNKPGEGGDGAPSNAARRSFKQRLRGFFGAAPLPGGAGSGF